MSVKGKLIRNTVANYLIRFWEIIIGLILFPFIVHHIGLSAAGIWLLVSSITGYFGLLDLGIGSSLIKYVAEYHVRKDNKKLSESINATFFIFLGMGLIASVGLFIVGRFFITSFNIPQELVEEARAITYIAAVTTLVGFPLGTFGGVLRGVQRYDLGALVGFIVSIPRVILTVIFLLMGYGVVTLVLINTFCSMIGWLLSTYYAKKLLPFVSIRPSHLNKEMGRTLFSFGSSLFIISACMLIIYPTDRLIIGAFLTVGMIPYYEAAYKIYRLVLHTPFLLSSAVMPTASELDVRQEIQSLRNLFISGTKYTTAIFLSLALPALFLSRQILTFWMGDDFSSYYLLANVFILHLFFNFNHIFAFEVLVGMNKIRFSLYYYVTAAIFNLALSIFLVQRIGLIGVVLGTAIPYAILEPIFVWYIFKTFSVSIKTYFKEVLLKTYPYAGVTAIFLYFASTYYLFHNLVEVGVFGLLSLGIYFSLFFIFGLEKSEKKDLIKTFSDTLSYSSAKVNKGDRK